MSRARRIEALVRIRDLQARVAEADALARRREADERLADVERARTSLDAIGATGGLLSFGQFANRRSMIDGGVLDVERRHERHVAADAVRDEAHRGWIDAHRRHEAIERIHGRVAEEEATEAARIAQVELDDLVVTRHGRPDQLDRPDWKERR